MKCLSVLTIIVLAASLLSAPIPQAKPVKSFEIAAGDWIMEWGAVSNHMPLTKEGGYSWGDGWEGNYVWDVKTNTLHVQETPKGGDQTIYRWHVKLDAEGKGISEGDNFAGASVRIKRATVELLPPPKVDPDF